MASERIAVVGCGLIGSSIAMAASRAGDPVSGWDPDPETLLRSASRAGFDAATSLQEAVAGTDLVFVCSPTQAIAGIAAEVLGREKQAVVTDAGSVKGPVVAEVAALSAASDVSRFVGSHPMAGSERSGPDAASPSLLDSAVWVLTPTAATDPSATARVEAFISRVGAQAVIMEPEKHDRVVAFVSHLPQVVSTALMALAAWEQEQGVPETLMLAAGGFRDLTRLAAANPDLWAGILRSNQLELTRAIDFFVEDLTTLRDHLLDDDPGALRDLLAEATRERRALSAKPQVRAGVAILQIPIPDRPGALADLTVGMSERSVNIEDLQIVHSPEGGKGTVHLTIAGSDIEAATSAAEAHGFEVLRIA